MTDLMVGLLGVICGASAATVAAAALWRRQRRQLDDLARAAVVAFTEPTATAAIEPSAATPELARLARAIAALRVRVRVAEDLVERERRGGQRARAGMADLLASLVAAEEAARGHLAAELHDTAAQSLAVARTILADQVTDDDDVAMLVGEAEDQLRAVMARTRPPALEADNLGGALSVFLDDLHRRYGLTVTTNWPDDDVPLPVVTATALYRFYQEALVNVVKHTDATSADLALHVRRGRLIAQVRDDGPGFDPKTVRPERGRHVGLALLADRIRLLGGRLTIDAAPGRGTCLVVDLPLPEAERGEVAPAQRTHARATDADVSGRVGSLPTQERRDSHDAPQAR